MKWFRGLVAVLSLVIGSATSTRGQVDFPLLAPGFKASLFAREPVVRHPVSLAFDAHGRMFVGQGPQFRSPKPDTPGDTIKILIDKNEDGVVDIEKTFATGFNCIQSLAWKGNDLWVANAPDLTIVRDLDGDDGADEYVLVYTDLGNIEHAVHGLNWGPDGKLYMSKGNSKGYSRPGRVAPLPFRELWGVTAPKGSPDMPPPRVFRRSEYKKMYHNPADDWGREGGVLRCDDMGRNLEIVARGFRNPWDMAFDAGFNFLGTDNDQNEGDKIFVPFWGAHFGWGHPWSYNWNGRGHLPTVPPSGPLFEGSGTGVVYCESPAFPPEYRGVFLINDWLRRQTYVYRPRWDGALMLPSTEKLPVLARADSPRSMGGGKGRRYAPTDLEIGPDGALYVLCWGPEYGARFETGKHVSEGRIYKLWHANTPCVARSHWDLPKRRKPHAEWTFDELVADLGEQIPVWRVNAQTELVRRGAVVRQALLGVLSRPDLPVSQETWLLWTFGRILPEESSIDALLVPWSTSGRLHRRLQALRILAHRQREWPNAQRGARLAGVVAAALRDTNARVRFAAAQAAHMARLARVAEPLRDALVNEKDRVTFYALWRALGDLVDVATLKTWLQDERAPVRRGVLLALLDRGALPAAEVVSLRLDPDDITAKLVADWLKKAGSPQRPVLTFDPPGGDFSGVVSVRLSTPIAGMQIRYSLDGSAPTKTTLGYSQPIILKETAQITAALFNDGVRVGPVLSAGYRRVDRALGAGAVAVAVRAESGSPYRLDPFGLNAGMPAYTDRRYKVTKIPRELHGAPFIQTANDDAGSRGREFLNFRVATDVTVYLAHDERDRRKPNWLRAGRPGGFTATDLYLETTDAKFRLYRRDFPCGEVALGGNTDDGRDSGRSNYLVILKPRPPAPQDSTATVAEVLPAVEKADAAAGRWLFFAEEGANCVRCHRLDERGNAYAPDLSDIARRIDLRQIVQSILEPSAQITEGFRTHVVVQKDGAILNGIVLEESGLALTVVPQDGKPVRVPKKSIARRSSVDTSAMPDNFGRLLAAAQVADLAAFLLTCDEPAKGTSAAAGNEVSRVVAFEKKADRVIVKIGATPVAVYVHTDPKISRPYLAHVRAPGGVQVTRNHPPGPNDAKDHATYHPGIALAFGDVSRNDYWRLRAKVAHDGFVGEPQGGQGKGTFVTRHRYLSRDGKSTVCVETLRLTFYVRPAGYLIDWTSEFTSGGGEFYFGDQEEMGLGIRVATPIAVNAKQGGRILDAEGRKNGKGVWGKAAAWCDYSGPVAGKFAGITVMPDPKNFRPCWWHARDYGFVGANPFGRRALSRGAASKVVVKPGEKFRLRFGLVLHAHEKESEYDAAAAYRDWLGLGR